MAFLKAAVAYYASLGPASGQPRASLGITVHRVMTDNGSCYKAHRFGDACRKLGLRHIRTRP